MPPPRRLDLVLVPAVCEPPALLRRKGGAPLQVTGPAPAIDVFFRPEEEHGASSEPYVVPPVVRRNGEMNDPFAVHGDAIPNFEPDSVAAITARCSDHGVFSERGANAQRVPDADAPVGLAPCLDSEARWYGAERVRCPDVAIVWGKNQYLACSKVLHLGRGRCR